jgi:translation initiation factor RLI1
MSAGACALTTSKDYFTKVLEDDLKAVVKPQYVDQIPKAVRSADKTVGTLMKGRAQMDNLEEIIDVLGMYSGWRMDEAYTDVH